MEQDELATCCSKCTAPLPIFSLHLLHFELPLLALHTSHCLWLLVSPSLSSLEPCYALKLKSVFPSPPSLLLSSFRPTCISLTLSLPPPFYLMPSLCDPQLILEIFEISVSFLRTKRLPYHFVPLWSKLPNPECHKRHKAKRTMETPKPNFDFGPPRAS